MRHLFLFLLILGLNVFAEDQPPLEAYGALPAFDMFVLSPSGDFAATRNNSTDEDLILVLDIAQDKYLASVAAGEANPRDLVFVADDRLVLVAGKTLRTVRVRRAFEYSQAFVFNTKSKSIRRLLDEVDTLYPYQGGLGNIIGMNPDTRQLYMPAYIRTKGGDDPTKGIYSVPLDSGRERIVAKGRAHTRDWLVDERGVPIVREDFDDRNNVHRIWTVDASGRTDQLLYETETDFPLSGFAGITPTKDALVVRFVDSDTKVSSYFLMSLEDGSRSGPVFDGGGLEVSHVIADVNRVVYGAEFAGFKPTYAFLDAELNNRVKAIQDQLTGVSSRLVGWDRDFSSLVFEVEGGWSSGVYILFDSAAAAPRVLGRSRPAIKPEHVAPVTVTKYQARDGLTIPALITAREDVLQARPAPTIILPHGGPESHDDYGFDWLAQFFASRGYVVFQPQFRGSDGFGEAHEDAGEGEMGAGMQFDVDDGTKFLIKQGISDPDRICIVGWSHGGYAALWAGAFSPDLYRCIAAIAPVTDVPKKMAEAKADMGREHWAVDYWELLYGIDASDKERLREISPAHHADSFEAPVLLVHGRNDTVVRPDHSKIMYQALRSAGKDVEYVSIRGDDHWMSQAETRIEMLRAVAEFIEEHL